MGEPDLLAQLGVPPLERERRAQRRDVRQRQGQVASQLPEPSLRGEALLLEHGAVVTHVVLDVGGDRDRTVGEDAGPLDLPLQDVPAQPSAAQRGIDPAADDDPGSLTGPADAAVGEGSSGVVERPDRARGQVRTGCVEDVLRELGSARAVGRVVVLLTPRDQVGQGEQVGGTQRAPGESGEAGQGADDAAGGAAVPGAGRARTGRHDVGAHGTRVRERGRSSVHAGPGRPPARRRTTAVRRRSGCGPARRPRR